MLERSPAKTLTDREYTLEWVNESRVFRGAPVLDELRSGRQSDCYGCPVARSLRRWPGPAGPVVRVWSKAWQERSGPTHMLPFRVQRFIRSFDAGKYPDLIA